MAGDGTCPRGSVPTPPCETRDAVVVVQVQGGEATFEEELREVKQVAGAVRTGRIEAPKSSPEPTEYEELLRIAEVSPRPAVSEAWRRVELAATEAARVAHIDVPPRSSVTLVVRSLVREGVFSESAVKVFDRLRQLRNQAVHAPDFALSYLEVEPYIEVALRLAQDLFHAGNAVAFGRGYRETVEIDGYLALHPTPPTSLARRR